LPRSAQSTVDRLKQRRQVNQVNGSMRRRTNLAVVPPASGRRLARIASTVVATLQGIFDSSTPPALIRPFHASAPNNALATAVTPIANAPQKLTLHAPISMPAPPAFAATCHTDDEAAGGNDPVIGTQHRGTQPADA
jgi:hypothetical protein